MICSYNSGFMVFDFAHVNKRNMYKFGELCIHEVFAFLVIMYFNIDSNCKTLHLLWLVKKLPCFIRVKNIEKHRNTGSVFCCVLQLLLPLYHKANEDWLCTTVNTLTPKTTVIMMSLYYFLIFCFFITEWKYII